jgi:GR25 family glycosyltransferase involved in LPS biosynthesis
MLRHIYFICNKEEENDRFVSLMNQINNLNIENYSIFHHIWKTQITPEFREKWVKTDTTMKYHGRNMLTNPLTNGEISLFLNHIECLREIRKNYKDGYFCIFESDAIFSENFNDNLIKVLDIAKEKSDVDIINIGCGSNQTPKSQPLKNELSLYLEKINKCTEGIIWTYKGVCNFLDYFDKTSDIDGPIDTKMDVYSEYIGGFNIYWAHPPLLYQGSLTGTFNTTVR